MCRMTSDIRMKSNKFKSKLQQIFVTCWFEFYAEFDLFIIIYCSVQIVFKHAVYHTVCILPSINPSAHSGYFALISSKIVGLSALPQQICIKMNVCK